MTQEKQVMDCIIKGAKEICTIVREVSPSVVEVTEAVPTPFGVKVAVVCLVLLAVGMCLWLLYLVAFDETPLDTYETFVDNFKERRRERRERDLKKRQKFYY